MASTVHVFNKTRRRSGSTVAPLEAITGKKPSLDHLRVFGCPAYVHIPSQRRTKMQAPSRKGIFVGYTPNSQSWMVYLPATRTVLSSRSVTFDEEWRPLSPIRNLTDPASTIGGTAPIDCESFFYKNPVTSEQCGPSLDYTPLQQKQPASPTTTIQSAILPPRLVMPTMPSSYSRHGDMGTSIQLAAPGVTCSGHRFRVSVTKFVPTAALPVILEDSDSSDTEDEDTKVRYHHQIHR